MSHSHSQEVQGLLSPFLAKQRYEKSSKFISADDVVLDLGCGVGKFREYLPKGSHYYGVDTQSNWGEESKYLFKGSIGEGLPRELENTQFTVITALAIIEHLDNPGQLFNDASKLLKQNGKVVLTTPHPLGRFVHDVGAKIGIFSSHASDEHEDFLDKKILSNTAQNEGFKMVEYERFLLGMNQVAVFSKE